MSRAAGGSGFLGWKAAGRWGFSISVSPQSPHHDPYLVFEVLGNTWMLLALGSHSAFWNEMFWTCWEYFPGFLSICCTARSVDAQCCTFCIPVITLHSSFQSLLLPITFLNLHSTLLIIFYSVIFFFKNILVLLLLEHCIFPKGFWSCSWNGMAMVFGQDPLFPCIGELFHLNLLVFCFFKFPFILFLTVLYKLYWFE